MNITPNPSNSGPLSGVRILDLATVLAAPFASTLCADLGASVIKVELPEGGDSLRSLAPVTTEHALFWKAANRGKKGISLDIRKPEGKVLLLRLLENTDVLVENFRTGTLARWGLDFETLKQANPRLIVLRLTGFGQTGPYASRPGFARIFEAMSGFAHLTGEADGAPQHMNFPFGDVVCGVFGAFTIAAAVAEQRGSNTPEPREIDLSATEALLRLLDPLPVEFEQLGVARRRAGSRATYTAPSNMYCSADGVWITLVGTSDAIFQRVTQAMGRPELTSDPRFATNPLRVEHLEVLDRAIADWCKSCTFSDLADVLSRHQVPFSKVYDIKDVMEDPHFKERQAIIRIPDKDLGSIPGPCVVPRFSGHTSKIEASGPDTGEHNAEVYGQLGLTADDLGHLKQAGVI